MTTQEDYVTKEVAEMMRQHGYKEKSSAYYYYGVFNKSCSSCEYNTYAKQDHLIDAPSLAEAQKWLREKHNLSVEICFLAPDNWRSDVWTIPGNLKTGHRQLGASYEKALNAGIQEALSLL